jgi:hypothetical protein
MADPTITAFNNLGDKLNPAFQLLNSTTWKNPPLSSPIVRQTMFFVATQLDWTMTQAE